MLLALHLALTLPLTCAVAVSAEGETLTQGGTVAENTSFTIDLGKNFTNNSTVYVQIDKVGESASYRWSPTVENTNLTWDIDNIENKVLTVGGDYIKSGTGSLAGLTLCDAVYDFMRTDYEDVGGDIKASFDIRKNSDGSYTVLRWRTVGAADIKYAKCVSVGNGANTQHYIQYQIKIEGETQTLLADFDPSQATGVCLSFASHPTLPTRRLEPGEYSHYFAEKEYSIHNAYAVVSDTEGVYKSFDGSVVGLKLVDPSYSHTVAKLTVEKDSVLDGAIFTGEEYNAQMVTFTAANGYTKDMLVYQSGYDANADEANMYSYKCIADGEIVDLFNTRENDTLTLTYNGTDGTYSATGAQYQEDYPLPGRVLFFKSDKSFGSGDNPDNPDTPVTPVTPAPSYPQYYPDYDKPTTVQPAPEAPEADANEYVVVCHRLNVRRTPSTRYARIGRLCRGDVVNVVEWVGKWAKIEWNGGTAYVHGNYISPVD